MHLKRQSAPTFWPLKRKESSWTIKPRPGPHREGIPLGILLRNTLKCTRTNAESKKILNMGYVKINGRACRDYNSLTGLLDVIEIVPTKEYYKMVPSKKGLVAEKTDKSDFYLAKVTNKVAMKKKFQYTLHNGRTLSSDKAYKVGDTLKIGFDGKVADHFPLGTGSPVIVTGGRQIGESGKIDDIKSTGLHRKKRVIISAEGKKVTTIGDYVFVTERGGK